MVVREPGIIAGPPGLRAKTRVDRPLLTSTRPYLIRAIYEWIGDNGLTPHLIVNAEREDVKVPPQHVQEGKVVLNISPTAIKDLQLGNDWISFSARFGGVPFSPLFPPAAVVAIYAKENGKGMAFPEEEPDSRPPSPEPMETGGKKPALRLVK